MADYQQGKHVGAVGGSALPVGGFGTPAATGSAFGAPAANGGHRAVSSFTQSQLELESELEAELFQEKEPEPLSPGVQAELVDEVIRICALGGSVVIQPESWDPVFASKDDEALLGSAVARDYLEAAGWDVGKAVSSHSCQQAQLLQQREARETELVDKFKKKFPHLTDDAHVRILLENAGWSLRRAADEEKPAVRSLQQVAAAQLERERAADRAAAIAAAEAKDRLQTLAYMQEEEGWMSALNGLEAEPSSDDLIDQFMKICSSPEAQLVLPEGWAKTVSKSSPTSRSIFYYHRAHGERKLEVSSSPPVGSTAGRSESGAISDDARYIRPEAWDPAFASENDAPLGRADARGYLKAACWDVGKAVDKYFIEQEQLLKRRWGRENELATKFKTEFKDVESWPIGLHDQFGEFLSDTNVRRVLKKAGWNLQLAISTEKERRTKATELELLRAAKLKMVAQFAEQRYCNHDDARVHLTAADWILTDALRAYMPPPPKSPVSGRTLASSNFKTAYGRNKKVPGIFEIGASLRDLLEGYCSKQDISWNEEGRHFLKELQDEAMENAQELVDQNLIPVAAQRMWTSTLTLQDREFCFILNWAVREDVEELADSVAMLTRAIRSTTELCVTGAGGLTDHAAGHPGSKQHLLSRRRRL